MKTTLQNYIGELNCDLIAMNDELNAVKESIRLQVEKNRPVDGATSMVRMGIVLGVRKRTEEVLGRLKQIVQLGE